MCARFIGLHYYMSVGGVAQGMPSSSVGEVFGHQWLSRWLKTGKWKDSHPAVAEHDFPEINSS